MRSTANTLCLFTVIGMVVFNSGEASKICFNTVALLFLVDVDNMAYAVGLRESARASVEAKGRVELTERQADQVWFVKRLVM